MKLRRWLAFIAVVAAVLSTIQIDDQTLQGGTILARSVDLGFSGSFLYCRAFDIRGGVYTREIALVNTHGTGLHYIDEPVGTRILFGSATEPHDLVPAIWLRRKAR